MEWKLKKLKIYIGGRHSTEVKFELLTPQSRVRILTLPKELLDLRAPYSEWLERSLVFYVIVIKINYISNSSSSGRSQDHRGEDCPGRPVGVVPVYGEQREPGSVRRVDHQRKVGDFRIQHLHSSAPAASVTSTGLLRRGRGQHLLRVERELRPEPGRHRRRVPDLPHLPGRQPGPPGSSDDCQSRT